MSHYLDSILVHLVQKPVKGFLEIQQDDIDFVTCGCLEAIPWSVMMRWVSQEHVSLFRSLTGYLRGRGQNGPFIAMNDAYGDADFLSCF